jgi:hypothetical protein
VGRGLSELQQDIIVMAYENKVSGVVAYHDDQGPVVTAHVRREQILQERFGWEPDGARPDYHYRIFSRTDIGHDRYNATMASLSRSLYRLEARGLVYLTHSAMAAGWSGAELTEEGEAAARRILEHRNTIG